MNAIAGIPYIEANFDKNGKLTAPVTVPAGVTDVIVNGEPVLLGGQRTTALPGRGLRRG